MCFSVFINARKLITFFSFQKKKKKMFSILLKIFFINLFQQQFVLSEVLSKLWLAVNLYILKNIYFFFKR